MAPWPSPCAANGVTLPSEVGAGRAHQLPHPGEGNPRLLDRSCTQRDHLAMTFHREGWQCQLVLFGSQVVLEAMQGDQRLSCAIQPGDSPHDCALELISHPRCLLPFS